MNSFLNLSISNKHTSKIKMVKHVMDNWLVSSYTNLNIIQCITYTKEYELLKNFIRKKLKTSVIIFNKEQQRIHLLQLRPTTKSMYHTIIILYSASGVNHNKKKGKSLLKNYHFFLRNYNHLRSPFCMQINASKFVPHKNCLIKR